MKVTKPIVTVTPSGAIMTITVVPINWTSDQQRLIVTLAMASLAPNNAISRAQTNVFRVVMFN